MIFSKMPRLCSFFLCVGFVVGCALAIQMDVDKLIAELSSVRIKSQNKAGLASEIFKKEGIAQVLNHTRSTKRDGKYSVEHLHPNLTASTPLPVVQMHGMGDYANNPHGMVPLAEDISAYLNGTYVLNVQIGDSDIADVMNGFLMNLNDQVDYFANVIQSDTQLANGFNAIGYSQGNLIIRGYIEKFNNPPVLNFISMHGPMSGVGSFPGCGIDKDLCKLLAEVLGTLAYKPQAQLHIAQANYYRDPIKIPLYMTENIFLPNMNNEVNTNSTTALKYKSNFESLKSICLVKALGDTVVIPVESEWFQFFTDGTFQTVWAFNETPWYTGDTFGLKTMHGMGRVYFNTTAGNHLDFETDFLLDLVGTYFV